MKKNRKIICKLIILYIKSGILSSFVSLIHIGSLLKKKYSIIKTKLDTKVNVSLE